MLLNFGMIPTAKKRLMTIVRRSALVAALSTFLPVSSMATVPVVDGAVIGNTAAMRALALKELESLLQMLLVDQRILNAIGQAGQDTVAHLMQSPEWQVFTSGGLHAGDFFNLVPNTCAITTCSVDQGNAVITSVADARAFLERSFFANRPITEDERINLSDIRQNAARDSAISGLALAMSTNSSLTQASSRMTSLENLTQSAESVRGEIKANTLVQLAQLNEMSRQTALLAGLLEIQATQALAQDRSYMQVYGGSDVLTTRTNDAYARDGVTQVRPDSRSVFPLNGLSRSSIRIGLPDVAGSLGITIPDGIDTTWIDPAIVDALPPIVRTAWQAAPTTSSLGSAGILINVARSVAAQTGAVDAQRWLSVFERGLHRYEQDGPLGAMISGVEAVARASGNGDIANLARAATTAVQTGQPSDARRVLRSAQQMAAARSDASFDAWLLSAADALAGGQISTADGVVEILRATTERYGGSLERTVFSAINENGDLTDYAQAVVSAIGTASSTDGLIQAMSVADNAR